MDQELLRNHGLERFGNLIEKFQKDAVAFSLSAQTGKGRSKLGGLPLLPADFDWPRSKNRPLDFLLQVDLAEIAPLDRTKSLSDSGLLTFFYDLEKQPWGFDPKNLDGFRVELVSGDSLRPFPLPSPEFTLPEHSLSFSGAITLPRFGSRAYDELLREALFVNKEEDHYDVLAEVYEKSFYTEGSPCHRLLGHSTNIQGDMQLEAQLVTNGLYCGDSSGFRDPRAASLEQGADDWILLLQLDSDDRAGFMWADCGMLYYWVRRDDLAARRFDRVWMALQCC